MWWQQYSYWVWSHNQTSASSWNAPQPAHQVRLYSGLGIKTAVPPPVFKLDMCYFLPPFFSQPDTNQQQNNQFNSYYPYQFNNPAVAQTWAGNYQGQPRVGGPTAQTEFSGNFLTLQIRIINGNFLNHWAVTIISIISW